MIVWNKCYLRLDSGLNGFLLLLAFILFYWDVTDSRTNSWFFDWVLALYGYSKALYYSCVVEILCIC